MAGGEVPECGMGCHTVWWSDMDGMYIYSTYRMAGEELPECDMECHTVWWSDMDVMYIC